MQRLWLWLCEVCRGARARSFPSRGRRESKSLEARPGRTYPAHTPCLPNICTLSSIDTLVCNSRQFAGESKRLASKLDRGRRSSIKSSKICQATSAEHFTPARQPSSPTWHSLDATAAWRRWIRRGRHCETASTLTPAPRRQPARAAKHARRRRQKPGRRRRSAGRAHQQHRRRDDNH